MERCQGGQAVIFEPKDTNFYSTDPVKMRMHGDLLQCQKEIERLNKKINQLENAGDELLKWLTIDGVSLSNQQLLSNKWNRAKKYKS